MFHVEQYKKQNINMKKEDLEFLKSVVRNVPDFPAKGIQFKDLTTLFKDPKAFAVMSDAL